MPDMASHRDDALALIIGTSDPGGVSIVGATGVYGARPGSGDSTSSYEDTRRSTTITLAKPSKEAGGRRAGTSDRVFLNAGLQQFGMSKGMTAPITGQTLGYERAEQPLPMHVRGLSPPRLAAGEDVLHE
eukprot:CAMPEP_0179195510 /NCGR_PEP_ID=MMETSP0796-20121207/97187_1 /TAXON_ID=73915 /ORGANISM="Pyrodinium bahamense, Strain pbaha01" /LENGTH=129 /DNA_ID=CAMNT_0020899863 /DNA_START=1 /DNA_END=387 /DNA_ORIENTATION=-